MPSPESDIPDLSIRVAPYELRNRGPWTTVDYLHWPRFSVGHTTGLSAGAGVHFQSARQMDTLGSLDFPQNQHHAEQIHGSQSVEVDGPSACHRGVDGLIAAENQESTPALFLRTADCLPIYIRNQNSDDPRFALVHAGWRGLIGQVVPRALNRFFDGPVELFVGPHIGVEDYEVGEEVISALEQCLKSDEPDLIDRGVITEDRHLDLFHILLIQLDDWKGDVETVWRTPMDTSQADPVPLLSYRKNQTKGRMVHWFFPRHIQENTGSYE